MRNTYKIFTIPLHDIVLLCQSCQGDNEYFQDYHKHGPQQLYHQDY